MLAMRIRNFRSIGSNCLALALLSGAVTSISVAGPRLDLQERLLQVDINRQQINETVLLLESASGELYVGGRDLERWRIRLPPATEALEYQNERYFSLRFLSSVQHRYDRQLLTLEIEVRAEAFLETIRRSPSDLLPTSTTPGLGGFFNYELFAADNESSQQRSGQFELGIFNRWGVGVTGLFVNQLASSAAVTRLDTTWTHDVPEKRETWRLGDSVSTSGTWGRSVRFGGLQFATNFATQPGFATFTPQSVVGQAVMPSTVDVFINNALVARQSVPPGPFTIGNLPVVSGAGGVRLVVRDLFGREQVVNQPFYASQALLRKGLSSFSYEAGYVREDFGQHSDSYGPWMATGTLRYGTTDQLTSEVHAEAMAGQATLGVGGDYLIARVGTMSAYLAGSRSATDSGGLMLLGIDRLTPFWSFGARMQKTTSGFAQVGDTMHHALPSQVSSANLSYVMGANGSVGVAYVSQIRHDQTDARILSVSYGVGVGNVATLSISALANLSGEQNTRLLAMLTVPLGASVSAGATAQASRIRGGGTQSDFTATAQRNLPGGTGYGYRLQTRSGQSSEGTLSLQNDWGTYALDAFQGRDTTATQVSASGGVALLGGTMFASRRIDQSFAVVEVPGYPNVRVLTDNQPAGHTDANGIALIPRLRAYDKNVVSIDQRDLPMDAEIGALTMTATPYFRSGVELKFPIKRARAATFTVVLEDGGALPIGSTVRVVGQADSALLGSEGEVYVVDMGAANVLRVDWHGRHCEFEVPYPAVGDPLPNLGTFICKGVQR